MSLFDKCIACKDVPITFEQIIKALVRIDADGNYYIPLKLDICDEDDELAVQCGSDTTAEQLFRAVIVMDDCEHCAIKVSLDASSLKLICDSCEEEQAPK